MNRIIVFEVGNVTYTFVHHTEQPESAYYRLDEGKLPFAHAKGTLALYTRAGGISGAPDTLELCLLLLLDHAPYPGPLAWDACVIPLTGWTTYAGIRDALAYLPRLATCPHCGQKL